MENPNDSPFKTPKERADYLGSFLIVNRSNDQKSRTVQHNAEPPVFIASVKWIQDPFWNRFEIKNRFGFVVHVEETEERALSALQSEVNKYLVDYYNAMKPEG